MNWFTIDKDGLAKVLERKGRSYVVWELVQNSWDADGVTEVRITLEPVPNAPKVVITVEDDAPGGFDDLAHAWTLFAPSNKKGDATKRGRFNLGEKLVLAVADEAEVLTTCGGVRFDAKGRHRLRRAVEKGSRFRATVRMTREQLAEAEDAIALLIPPEGVLTTYNGRPLRRRKAVHEARAYLETEVADDDGALRRSNRTTIVTVYPVNDGEVPHLYEMGIPVVPIDTPWHVDVAQKIPLNLDRMNVPKGYLTHLKAVVLDGVADQLDEESAREPWVQEAAESWYSSSASLERVLDLRFGKERASYDVNDPEANKRCVAKGINVVAGGAMTSALWDRAKENGLIKSAGEVMPTPQVYNEDGRLERILEPEKWTDGMRGVVAMIQRIGLALLGKTVTVRLVVEPHVNWAANYGGGSMTLNVGRLGRAWFNDAKLSKVLKLAIHELAHEYSGDHLSDDYHDAICTLAAQAVVTALENPEAFGLGVGDDDAIGLIDQTN